MSELAKAKAKKIVDAAKIKAKARISAVTVKAAIALEKAIMKVGNAANAKTSINALKAKSKIAIAAIKEKCSIAVNTAIIKAKKYLNSKKKKGGDRTENLSMDDQNKIFAKTTDGAKMRASYIKYLIYENAAEDDSVHPPPGDQIIFNALNITKNSINIAQLVKRFLKNEINDVDLINKINDINELNPTIKQIIKMYIAYYMASPNKTDLSNDALSLSPNRSSHALPSQQQRSSIFRKAN